MRLSVPRLRRVLLGAGFLAGMAAAFAAGMCFPARSPAVCTQADLTVRPDAAPFSPAVSTMATAETQPNAALPEKWVCLTSGKCGTIFKQSAQTASHLRCLQGCANRICEGGGTGRRARLRCVWFILGGSSPLPRTRKTLRNIEENSMLRGVFFLPSCQILPDTAAKCLILRCHCQKM